MQDQPNKKTTFSATVFDPAPPPSLVWLLPFALLWTLAAVFVAPVWPAALLAALGTALALGARPRRRPREVILSCQPGSVRLGARGSLLRAREIVGATTARHDGRVSLLLEHSRRRRKPIVLSLPDDAALHAVCDSLGIGHHGFGVVDAVATAPSFMPLRQGLSGMTLALLLGTLLSTRWVASDVLALLTMVTLLASFATLMMFLQELGAARPILRLTSQGVYVPSLMGGSTFVPFLGIERVDVLRNGLSLTLTQAGGRPMITLVPAQPSRWAREGLSAAELEHLAAQIRAASERAHGRFALKDEPSSAIEMLRRQQGETLRAWFSRLDTLGTGTAGYRTTTVESADLWKVLEDPEAEADLRSAAARLLARRAPEVRTRVGDVLAAVRDERVRTRIAASVDDELLAREEEVEAAQEKNRPHRA